MPHGLDQPVVFDLRDVGCRIPRRQQSRRTYNAGDLLFGNPQLVLELCLRIGIGEEVQVWVIIA